MNKLFPSAIGQKMLNFSFQPAGTDFAKVARSVNRDSNGRVQGSTKDPIKQKAVEEAKKHGIGKRTAENGLKRSRGPTEPKQEKEHERAQTIAKQKEQLSGKQGASDASILGLDPKGKRIRGQPEGYRFSEKRVGQH